MKEYKIKTGLFGQHKKLILEDNYLEWNGARIEKSEIVDFKHGAHRIVWYEFYVGLRFSMTLKNQHDKEVKIMFSSYFGMNRQNRQSYFDIVNDIWGFYFSAIVARNLDIFYSSGELAIQGLKLKDEGIQLRDRGTIIPWEKVATRDYHTYFAIYHKDNSEMHSRVSFNEYGTETLWSAIRAISQEKQNTREK